MSIEKTVYYTPAEAKSATLVVIDKTKMPKQIELRGDMTFGREYPQSTSDIRVNSSIVGRNHGEFVYDDSSDTYYYIDKNSLNGTFINGNKLAPYNQRGSKAVELFDGDIIRVDRSNLYDPHPESVIIMFNCSLSPDEKWELANTKGKSEITIGRGESNCIRLDDIMASREHAVIEYGERGTVIFDRKSQNGIYVNGRKVNASMPLFCNDVIRIANTFLIFTDNAIFYNHAGEKAGLLSVKIEKKAVNHGKKILIKDINFQVDSGEFILILGGSGAGKTTLVNAILGDGKADGKIMLDGLNLYENFNTMKSQIGIVPQFINLRLNDKVNSTLMDIADIKLDKKYYSKQDKCKRIDDIMNRLGIKNLENHLISQLSGGQKKKVSVAAQLIGFQKVFICDEPDSGLDAASRMQQMEILKEISLSEKKVMVISHEPDDAIDRNTGDYLFTKVLVLAKSSKDNCGHLAFFGSPQDALKHFEVNKLQNIMVKINPDYEGGQGLADYYIDRFNSKGRG